MSDIHKTTAPRIVDGHWVCPDSPFMDGQPVGKIVLGDIDQISGGRHFLKTASEHPERINARTLWGIALTAFFLATIISIIVGWLS